MKNYTYKLSSKFLALGFILLFSFSIFTCSDSNIEPESVDDISVYDVITITTKQFNSVNMEIGSLAENEFHDIINTNGRIDVPPENRVSVSPYFNGFVKNLTLLPGEEVKKGETLFSLENPDFIQVQRDYLETKSQLSYLASDYERQKYLFNDNISSQKNYLKAEAEYLSAKIKTEALSKTLKIMNIDSETLTGETIKTDIPVKAPIDGHITEIHITKGSFINPSDIALTIIDSDHIHLELSIFESDLPNVKVGQKIQFFVQNQTIDIYSANVHLINKAVSLENRSVDIHGHLDDESVSSAFTVGMYVEAEIYTSSHIAHSLPEEAVVNIEDKYFALLQTDSNSDGFMFKQVEIMPGKTTNGFIEILNSKSFPSGAQFLTKGAFNVINE